MEFSYVTPSSGRNSSSNNNSSNNSYNHNNSHLFQQQQYNNSSSINAHVNNLGNGSRSLIQSNHPQNGPVSSTFSNEHFNFPLRTNRNFPNNSTTTNSSSSSLRSQKSSLQQVNKGSQEHDLLDNSSKSSRVSRQSRGGDLNHQHHHHHHHQQQHYLQNINEQQQEENHTDENNMSSSTTATSPPCPPPVYRIFKRGDTIPGLTSPLGLQMNVQNNEANNGANSANNVNSNSHNMQLENSNESPVVANNIVQSSSSSSSSLLTLELINNHHQQQEGGVVTSSNSLSSLSGNNNVSSTTTLESDSNCPTSDSQQSSTTKANRTPISIIGDIARFHGLTAVYRLTNETGPPHAPTFTVVLVLGNEQYQAQGSSIKKAQLSAAAMAVEKTSLTRPPSRAQPKKAYNQNGTGGTGTGGFHSKRTNWTIMQLNTLAEELDEKVSFASQPVPIVNPYGRSDPPSQVVVRVGEKLECIGKGPNFNAAKNQAAVSALKALLEMKREREILKLAESGNLTEEIDTDGKSPISVCHEMALKRGLHVFFEVKGEEGPPHLKVFTVRCIVREQSDLNASGLTTEEVQYGTVFLSADGNGPTKQQAKKSSCELMITKLKDVPLKLPKLATGISLKAMQKGLLKPKVTRKKPTTPVVKEVDKQIVSPVSRLLQIAHVKKYREPEFSIVKATEGSEQISGKGGRNKKRKPIFTMEVKVGPHVCQGTGPNKKAAKKAAADAALVVLGYTPSTEPTLTNNGNGSANSDSDTANKTSDDATTKTAATKENESNYKTNSPVKLQAYRQIVPGVLVVNSSSETNGNSTPSPTASHVAQEMNKMNSSVPPVTSKTFDGIGKLSYLAELLGVSVSYSDFPKKNEFLSVVSIGKNPPHVAHGTGPTREEAQNSAALQILEELSTSGLDSVTNPDSSRVSIKSEV